MPSIFDFAPQVQAIANGVIPEHHPHLIDEPIVYVFKDKHSKRNGKVVLGTASLVGGRQAFFALSEEQQAVEMQRQGQVRCFVIEIAMDTWVHLTDEQKKALVDHELCHCFAEDVEDKDENLVRELSIRGHDVEEFGEILKRHGLWENDIRDFAQVCHEEILQLKLFEDKAPLEVQEGGAKKAAAARA